MSDTRERTERDGLYPLQALVQPVSLRFKYHFEGTRQTNRLDKVSNTSCRSHEYLLEHAHQPEWYFTHVLNASHEHKSFMETVIQPLIAQTEYRNIIAWREFTLLLVPLLSRKLRKTVPALIPHPPVLAHTIYQALTFDSSLREEGFELGGTSAALEKEKGAEIAKWQGISEVILGRKEWFEAWMEGERTCKCIYYVLSTSRVDFTAVALDQYMQIISAQDAWLIADDSEDADEESTIDRELKPTNSARRVKALVEQVTGTYLDFLLTRFSDCFFRSLFASTPVYAPYTVPHRCTTPSPGIIPCPNIFLSRCVRDAFIHLYACSSGSFGHRRRQSK